MSPSLLLRAWRSPSSRAWGSSATAVLRSAALSTSVAENPDQLITTPPATPAHPPLSHVADSFYCPTADWRRAELVASNDSQRLPQPSDAGEDASLRVMLKRMTLIREVERRLAQGLADGDIKGAVHSAEGQEAVAVGVGFALGEHDLVVSNHRPDAHVIAKGMGLVPIFAECMGRSSGSCRGMGGAMHIMDVSTGTIGANGVVGAGAPVATGASWGQKYAQAPGEELGVTVCYLGDGAMSQGFVHEAMNMAAVWETPCLFVIENNHYSMFSHASVGSKLQRLSERARVYGIPEDMFVTVDDGNDVSAVHTETRKLLAKVRAGRGPAVLECMTWRTEGHYAGDEEKRGQSAEDRALWAQEDRVPVLKLAKKLGMDKVGFAALVEECQQEVERAYARAASAPFPDASEMQTDIFAPDPAYVWGVGAAFASAADRATKAPLASRDLVGISAINEALAEEMRRDARVVCFGEDIDSGSVMGMTKGLIDEFGATRVANTPIAENGFVGAAIGAAITGSARPVVEIINADILTCCTDMLVNQAAKMRYMSGGQVSVPIVVRATLNGPMMHSFGMACAAQHSQTCEPWLLNVPGLIIAAPSTPADAKGMLKAAIRSNNPVIFFESVDMLVSSSGVPAEPPPPDGANGIVPLGMASVAREGSELTVVSYGGGAIKARAALEVAAAAGVDAELVDLRTIKPLDVDTVLASVRKTGRLMVVEEAHRTGGVGAEIIASVMDGLASLSELRALPVRVTQPDVPMPYGPLEANVALSVPQIVDAVMALKDAK